MAGPTPYRVGWAVVGGRGRVVVVTGTSEHLVLDQPGSEGEPPPTAFRDLITEGATWAPRLEAVAAGRWPATRVERKDVAWELPHLGNKMLCIGANYTDHIVEMNVPPPPWPYSFAVPPSTTLVGDREPVEIPVGVEQWDWEAELAVVLGAHLRYADVGEALEAVAYYVPFNDLSARDAGPIKVAFGVDINMIKAHDRSKVVGSLFTPAALVADPQDLHITCTVNGVRKQDLHTSNMIFTVAECLAHLSSMMTLEPGDIIATGTGGGVGILRDPPEVLADGDHVVVAIDGLGRAETPIVGSRSGVTLPFPIKETA